MPVNEFLPQIKEIAAFAKAKNIQPTEQNIIELTRMWLNQNTALYQPENKQAVMAKLKSMV